MLRIRLSRIGKKKQPAYRLVVTDQRNPREGAHLEVIGHYNPLVNPAALTIKEERAIHWLKVGAQPSDAAAKILTKAGLMEQAGVEPFVYAGKQMPKGSKNPRKGGGEEAAAAPAPAAAAPAATATAEAPVAEPAAEAPAAEPAADAEPEETPAAEVAAEEPAAEEKPAEEPAAEEAAPAEDTESS